MLATLRAMDPGHSGQTLLRSFYGFADDMTSALQAAARRIGLETG